MERPTILLTLALVLVGTCSSAVIWSQHNRIQALTVRNQDADTDRAKLRRQLAAEEARESSKVPEAEAAAEPTAAETMVAEERPGPPAGGPRNRDEMRNRGVAAFAELMADPEVSALMISQRKAALDSRYAALFRRLGLNPQETEALKSLLAEKQMARMEAGVMARAEGLGRDDRDEVRDLIRASDNDVESKIKELLGPDRFNTLATYEQTANERAKVDQFATRLSYSPTPLQGYQTDALVQMLAAVKPPRSPGRGATSQDTTAYLDALQQYSAEIYSRSQSVLSPGQLESLRQFQQEQIDQARLGTLLPARMREQANLRGRPGG